MAYTQADLTALKAALANPHQSVSYGGQTVTFRSVAEIKEAIVMVERALASKPRNRVVAVNRINTR